MCRIQWLMFSFFVFDRKYLFWSQNLNLFVRRGIWYLDQFEYVEFNSDVHFFHFLLEIPCFAKVALKKQIFSLSWNLVPRLISVLVRKYLFWVNFVQKMQTVRLSWNLLPRLILTCTIQWRCSLFYFRLEIFFLGKYGPKYQNCQFMLKFLA